MKVLYRAESYLEPGGNIHIQYNEYPIISETKCGVWISLSPYMNFPNIKKKFVLNDAVKRFAYPTKEEALTALIRRKQRQLEIIEYQKNKAERTILEIDRQKYGDSNEYDDERCRNLLACPKCRYYGYTLYKCHWCE